MCRLPNESQRKSLELLLHSSVPHDAEGNPIDLPPGMPIPDGASPARAPYLYPAASWTSATFCRCFPEQCRIAEAELEDEAAAAEADDAPPAQ